MSSSLISRFVGPEGHSILVEALSRQRLLLGDRTLAEAFAKRGQTIDVEAGQSIIEEGTWGQDLFFILAGHFEVVIKGQVKGERGAGVHVGELAGLSPHRPRTATVRATAESVVFKVDAKAINDLVGENAEFWKAAADVVADRLDQRNAEIGTTNECPRVFLISSSEGLEIVREVRGQLYASDLDVETWDQGTFGISEYPISPLEDAIEASDFTIAVVRADDSLIMRGTTMKAARDNVHLEYGISLGKLGRPRSILLVESAPDLRLPSDQAGLTTLRYRDDNADARRRSIQVACDEIRKHIHRVGVRRDRRTA